MVVEIVKPVDTVRGVVDVKAIKPVDGASNIERSFFEPAGSGGGTAAVPAASSVTAEEGIVWQ